MVNLPNFSLAVKPSERSSVFLFFLHNFFIGIGSILIYTAANVILLDNHPEFSLPLAYIISAVVMMVVGKIYEYFEHHLLLKTLSIRVLVVASLLSALIVLATLFNHSMSMAIGIMVTFRVIYLLVNLEFWGVSAVIFDVRQSKRLFSIIGSGDMPAKMLGAILAALIHSQGILPILLTISALMFISALFTQRIVLEDLEIPPKEQQEHHATEKFSFSLKKLLARSEMALRLCVGFGVIAMIAIFVEYSFFLNVKHKFHSQHELTAFVGKIIAITYFVGLILKILISRRVLERIGLQKAVFILPLMVFLMSATLTYLMSKNPSEELLLIYYCGYYLAFEVVRRTLFDPVFLIFFQPLDTHQRLNAHTLAKGFFEPLGIGLMGVVLLLMYYFPNLNGWFDFLFIAILAFAAIFIFNAAYRSYLFVLNFAIKKRFIGNEDLSLKSEARKIYLSYLDSDQPEEAIAAMEWFKTNEPAVLQENFGKLLNHSDNRIRLLALKNAPNLKPEAYFDLLKKEDNSEIKHRLAYNYCKNSEAIPEKIEELLQSNVPDIQLGAIVACLENPNLKTKAQQVIEKYLGSSRVDEQLKALKIIEASHLSDYQPIINGFTNNENEALRKKAIELGDSNVVFPLIADKNVWKSVVVNVGKARSGTAELIQDKLASADTILQQRLLLAVIQSNLPEKERLLGIFTQKIHTRLRATKALVSNNLNMPPTSVENMLEEEFSLAKRIFEGKKENISPALEQSLNEEITQISHRIFHALMLQYDKLTILNVMYGLQHLSKEKRANSFETLENTLPRSVCQRLQVLIDDVPEEQKIEILQKFSKNGTNASPLTGYILEKGDETFGDWTVAMAIRQTRNEKQDFEKIKKYFSHPKSILSETAWELQDLYKENLTALAMSHSTTASHISTVERTIILKNTALFAQTPENVLTALAPILQEVAVHQHQIVFNKGDLGDSMYLIYSGEVGVFDGKSELARFKKYDFFGELALLDSETRSASIVALTDALLFKISQEDFYELLEERPELMRNIIKSLSQRIRNLNAKVRER